jgi:hypothetical protein
MSVDDQLVVLFQQMADMTLPECKSCRVPLSCCDSMYCGCAEEYAKEEWGVDLTPLKTDHPKLPFMGPDGCVVPPHLRPLCSLHTCSINNIGIKPGDPAWTEKYFKVREQIEELEDIRSTQREQAQHSGETTF